MSFTPDSLIKSFGLQNSKIGQGIIGLNKEEGKFKNQLYVLGVLFVALVLGIIAVVLFSTGVSDLESYSEYFNSTGHKVAIGFAAATLITLVIAGFMLDSSLECAETTRARETGRSNSPAMPNIIGSVPPYVRAPSPVYQQRPPPVYQQPVYQQQRPPVYRQPIYQQQQRPPRPPQPPGIQIPYAQYPQIPIASPAAPIAYPQAPTQSPTLATTFATALPGLINAAAPIALAAANAPQGQRGLAAFNAAAVPLQ